MFKKMNTGIAILLALFTACSAALPVFAQTATPPPGEESTLPPSSGGRWMNRLAEALSMPLEELKTALKEGKTVAQLAQEKNINLDTLVNELTQPVSERLASSVSAGKITQVQADQRLNTIKTGLKDWFTTGKRPSIVNRTLTVLRDGKIIADELKMSMKDLGAAIKNGKTINQLAAEKGVNPETLLNLVLDAHSKTLQKAVEAGKLSQAQADEQLAALKINLSKRFEDGTWRLNSRQDGVDGVAPSSTATPPVN